MPRKTLSETAAERRARKARQAAADRAAKARQTRKAKGRPDKRAVNDAIGAAVDQVLRQAGAIRPSGRFDPAALARHPDLVAVLSTATDQLAQRFDRDQIKAVLEARYAHDGKPPAPEPEEQPPAIPAHA